MPRTPVEKKVPRKKSYCSEMDVDHLEVTCPHCKGEGTVAVNGVTETDPINWNDLDHQKVGTTLKIVKCLDCRGRGTIPSRSGLKLLEFLDAYKDYDVSGHPFVCKWKEEDENHDEEDD